jgi:hypothetical protein
MGCVPTNGDTKRHGEIIHKCLLFSVPNYATWAGD